MKLFRWNKEGNEFSAGNIKYTIQFQGHFSQYWNELAEKESDLRIITTWKEESKSKFENMRKDKLSKESAEYQLEKTLNDSIERAKEEEEKETKANEAEAAAIERTKEKIELSMNLIQ